MGKLKVISLWAEPGAGKSTTAAGMFNLMKRERYSCELVTEVAKDLTYEKSFKSLSDQLLILAEQHHRLHRLKGEVEWVICDSPFPLGLAYADVQWRERLWPLIASMWMDYDNYGIRLNRGTNTYVQSGRNQTEQEAATLAAEINRIAYQFGALHIMDASKPTIEWDILKVLNLPLPLAERHY